LQFWVYRGLTLCFVQKRWWLNPRKRQWQNPLQFWVYRGLTLCFVQKRRWQNLRKRQWQNPLQCGVRPGRTPFLLGGTGVPISVSVASIESSLMSTFVVAGVD
jgi:hypothetical protein